MAIARKNRRPFQVDGREFLWWVYEDCEAAAAMTLAVSSADKSFLVHYQIEQPDDSRHLTVVEREFPGLPAHRPSWARPVPSVHLRQGRKTVRCPRPDRLVPARRA